ncbi:hypothetical protein ATANTOWER_030012, partial [Ataeniobius toweri]|nr:hypothetical protein [Ataeniobius toweri]
METSQFICLCQACSTKLVLPKFVHGCICNYPPACKSPFGDSIFFSTHHPTLLPACLHFGVHHHNRGLTFTENS